MWYKTGTVTATKNQTGLTGVSTKFISNVRVGEAIALDDGLHEITNIASDAAMSISPAYTGTTGVGKSYYIIPIQGYVKKLADKAALLLEGFENPIQQDDERLSDAREWTAATVSKAEAEAGVATARRAWSSLRVREAITGWWAGFGTSYGRGFIGLTNAEAARAKVGLVNGVGLGQNIINSAVSGVSNISYSDTLLNTTSGHFNTASGFSALRENTGGGSNAASGFSALRENTTGNSNTASGASALLNNTTGSSNTAIGFDALRSNITGSFNAAIGRDALRSLDGLTNCTGMGYNSAVTASNQVQLGNSAATTYTYGAVQNRSDERDKAEIRDTHLGLDFILAQRPVDYKWDMREDYRPELGGEPTAEQLEAYKLANIKADGTHTRDRYHHGLIAQEVAATLENLNVDFGGFQDHSKMGGDDVLSLGYEEFIAPLIKAVQELNAKITMLEGKK